MKPQELLIDLLTVLDRFKDVVSHVMMKPVDGNLLIAAKARDGSISIMGKSKGEVEELTERACLGNLTFLRTSLLAPSMKKGAVACSFDKAMDGKTIVLRSMTLSGEKKFSVFYQAVDPFINQLNRIKPPEEKDRPILFAIDKPFMARFEEVFKVNAQAPKIGTDLDDIFTMTFHEGTVDATFGQKGNQATTTLTDSVELVGKVDKVSAMFSASRLLSILKLVGDEVGVGYLSDKSLKVDIRTKYAEYEIIIFAKKVHK